MTEIHDVHEDALIEAHVFGAQGYYEMRRFAANLLVQIASFGDVKRDLLGFWRTIFRTRPFHEFAQHIGGSMKELPLNLQKLRVEEDGWN